MISIQIRSPDLARLAQAFDLIPTEVHGAIAHVVQAAALKIENHAKRAILRGPKTGRLYRGSKKKMHRASAPGEAPATDTGRLASSIYHRMIGADAAEVSTDVDYAGYLEFGTRKMAPRPYLKPALDAVAPEFVNDILEAMGELLR